MSHVDALKPNLKSYFEALHRYVIYWLQTFVHSWSKLQNATELSLRTVLLFPSGVKRTKGSKFPMILSRTSEVMDIFNTCRSSKLCAQLIKESLNFLFATRTYDLAIVVRCSYQLSYKANWEMNWNKIPYIHFQIVFFFSQDPKFIRKMYLAYHVGLLHDKLMNIHLVKILCIEIISSESSLFSHELKRDLGNKRPKYVQ